MGLSALLAFIALEMLASPWFKLPIAASLAVIGVILAATALDSAIRGNEAAESGSG